MRRRILMQPSIHSLTHAHHSTMELIRIFSGRHRPVIRRGDSDQRFTNIIRREKAEKMNQCQSYGACIWDVDHNVIPQNKHEPREEVYRHNRDLSGRKIVERKAVQIT